MSEVLSLELLNKMNTYSQYGEDLPEVRNWSWSGGGKGATSQDTGGDNV